MCLAIHPNIWMPDPVLIYAGQDEPLARYLTTALAHVQESAYLLLLSPTVHTSLRVQTQIAQALAARQKFATLVIEPTPLDELLFVLDHPRFELTRPDQAADALQGLAAHFGLTLDTITLPDAAVFTHADVDMQAENRAASVDPEALFFAAAELIPTQPGSAIYLYQYLKRHAPTYADGQIGVIADQMITRTRSAWLQLLEKQTLAFISQNHHAEVARLVDRMQTIDADHPLTQAVSQQWLDMRLNELQAQAQTVGWQAAGDILQAMQAIAPDDERTRLLADLITQNLACAEVYAQIKRAMTLDRPLAVASLLNYMRDHCPDYGDPDGLMRGAVIRAEFIHNLRPAARLQGHTGAVQTLAFAPDGTLLVSGAADGTLRLWDVEQHQQVAVQRPDDGSILHVSYSQDGAFLVTTATSGVVRIWSMPEAREAVMLDQFQGSVTRAVFTPDAAHLICGYNDGRLEVIRIDDGAILVSQAAHAYAINRLQLAPDGTRLLTASDDRLIKLWQFSPDPPTLSAGQVFTGHTMLVNDAALSEDRVASVSNDGTLKLWDATSGAVLWSASHDHNAQTRSVCFSPHVRLLVAGTVDRRLHCRDVDTGALLATLEAHEGAVNCLTFSPDGTLLASGSSDRAIILWQPG